MTPLVSPVPILTAPPAESTKAVAPGGTEDAFALILSQRKGSTGSDALSDQTSAEAPLNGGSLSGWWPEQGVAEQAATDSEASDALAAQISLYAGQAIAPVPGEGPAIAHPPCSPSHARFVDNILTPPEARPTLAIDAVDHGPTPGHASDGITAHTPQTVSGQSEPRTGLWPNPEPELFLTKDSSGATPPFPSSPGVLSLTAVPGPAPASATKAPHPPQTTPGADPTKPPVSRPPAAMATVDMSLPPPAVGETADRGIAAASSPGQSDTMPMVSKPAATPSASATALWALGVASDHEGADLEPAPAMAGFTEPKPGVDRRDGPAPVIALPSGFGKASLRALPVTVSTGLSLAVTASQVSQLAATSDEHPLDVTEGNSQPVTQAAQTLQPATIGPAQLVQPVSVDLPASVASADANPAPPDPDSATWDATTQPAPGPAASAEVTSEKGASLNVAERDTSLTPVATHGAQDTLRPERTAPFARAEAVLPSPQAQVAAAVAVAQDQTVELLLAPEELGQVRIDLRREGETIVVSVSAERQDTLDLLRRNADQLALDLRAASQAGVSLSFGRWTGSDGGAPGDGQAQRADSAADGSAPQPGNPVAPTASALVPTAGLYLRI